MSDLGEKLAAEKLLKAAAIALHDQIAEDLAALLAKSMQEKSAIATGKGQGVGGVPQGTAGTDTCYCKCGATVPHERGTPCAMVKCPKCGKPMAGFQPVGKAK